MSVVLFIQALFLEMVEFIFGANCFNMAFLLPNCRYFINKLIKNISYDLYADYRRLIISHFVKLFGVIIEKVFSC
ncbi:MAG: energy-coupling factor ABC transporter permease [Candidatus Riflebacteria bacterium]|nr:energy-coupling factor ABC transporter permease [Candidatus Riflebacteria bacterium]